MAFSGSLPQNLQDVWVCVKPNPDVLASLRCSAGLRALEPDFLSLLTRATLCFMSCVLRCGDLLLTSVPPSR